MAESRRFERAGRNDVALANIGEKSRDVKCTLVTVAYNVPELISLQIEALRECFVDSFVHVILDNSSLSSAREAIRDVCLAEGAEYVGLPPNPATGSRSHGLALNWAFANIGNVSNSAYIGFLDHDVFPFLPCSYVDIVRAQGSYGHFQQVQQHRFYWPGLMFFEPNFLSKTNYDFQPRWLNRKYGDTGASNWPSTYKYMDVGAIRTMAIYDLHSEDLSRVYVKTGVVEDFLRDALTVLDDRWVHLVNGSNWAAIPGHREKLDDLRRFLRDPSARPR